MTLTKIVKCILTLLKTRLLFLKDTFVYIAIFRLELVGNVDQQCPNAAAGAAFLSLQWY